MLSTTRTAWMKTVRFEYLCKMCMDHDIRTVHQSPAKWIVRKKKESKNQLHLIDHIGVYSFRHKCFSFPVFFLLSFKILLPKYFKYNRKMDGNSFDAYSKRWWTIINAKSNIASMAGVCSLLISIEHVLNVFANYTQIAYADDDDDDDHDHDDEHLNRGESHRASFVSAKTHGQNRKLKMKRVTHTVTWAVHHICV